MTEAKKCSTSDCSDAATCKGMCNRCYQRDYQRRKREGHVPASRGPRRAATAPIATKPRKERPALAQTSNESPQRAKHVRSRGESVLPPRIRAIFARTKAARAELDAIIALDEPDPEYDGLQVIVLGKPRDPRKVGKSLQAGLDPAPDENVLPRQKRSTRGQCGHCHEKGHRRDKCPKWLESLRAAADSARDEESSNVTASAA